MIDSLAMFRFLNVSSYGFPDGCESEPFGVNVCRFKPKAGCHVIAGLEWGVGRYIYVVERIAGVNGDACVVVGAGKGEKKAH